MKVSASSWHWRLYRRVYEVGVDPDGHAMVLTWDNRRRRLTLCRYFWRVVGLLVLGLVLATAAAAGVVALAVLTLDVIHHPWDGLIVLGVLGAVALWVSCILGAGMVVDRRARRQHDRRMRATERRENVLAAYLRARKKKWCPFIEVDGDG